MTANLKSSLHVLLLLALAFTNVVSFSAAIDDEFINKELERIQINPDHSISFEIDSSREFVFQFLSHRVHDYTKAARAVIFDHDNSVSEDRLDVGSVRITTMENGELLAQRFLLYDPPNTYAYFTDMESSSVKVPLSYSIAHYEFTSITREKTRFEVSVGYQSSSRLLSFFVRRVFNSALANDFESAVELIEAEYRQTINAKEK